MMVIYLSTDGDLFALIRAKQSSRAQEMNGFFDKLEQKYASGSKTGKSKKGAGPSKDSGSSTASGSKTGKGKGRRRK